MNLPTFWYRRTLTSWLLLPLSWLFCLIITLRRLLFRCGWHSVYRASVPVIIIGNITVGGSGKTPLVIALAKQLHTIGMHCAIVSRGYGGKLRAKAIEVTNNSDTTVVGDEPTLIYQQTGIPVFVATRRTQAVQLALSQYPQTQIIICDDGLQHYALDRDMEIAVFASDFGIGNGQLLPAGPLREPIRRIASCDAVVITGNGYDTSIHHPYRYCIKGDSEGVYRLTDKQPIDWKALSQYQPLYLLTAIARPKRISEMLKLHNISLKGQRFLPDHAPLSVSDAAFAPDGYLLLTGKDAVKIADWPMTLRQRILVLDYQFTIPIELTQQILSLISQHHPDKVQ